MDSNNGALHFEPRLELNKVKADIAEMKRQVSSISQHAAKEANVVNRSVSSIVRLGAGVFSVTAASRFVRQVSLIRGEFEQLEVAFETMLGTKEKADRLMGQVVQFASTTPFELSEVASGTKQLLAYRIEQEKIIPTLKALGDVSAGLSVPIGRLILNYGQVKTAAKLTGRELRDFNMAGVPLLAELAKNLGKAETEIQEMVSAGKIGFKEVEAAFKSMSDEGGQFANLMDKQSQTITGQLSNLRDNVDKMFNDIGQSSEGFIKDSISGIGYLVENYEVLGKTIAGLVATYGSYRVALMLVTRAQKLSSQAALIQAVSQSKLNSAQKVGAVATLNLRKAQAALNKTMLANPYVLVASAVVGLVTYMALFRKEVSLTERVTKEYNDRLKEQAEQSEEAKTKAKELINVAKDSALSNYERINALNKLKEAYPKIFAKYDVEKLKLTDILDLQRQIAEEERTRANQSLANDIKAEKEKIKQLKSDLNSDNPYSSNNYEQAVISRELEEAEKRLQLQLKQKDKNALIEFQVKIKNQSKDELKRELAELKNAYETEFEIAGAFGNKDFDTQNSNIKKRIELVEGLLTEEKTATRSIADIRNNILETQKEITNLQNKSKQGLTADEAEKLKELQDTLKGYNSELELYTGKKSKKVKETKKELYDYLQLNKEVNRKIEDETAKTERKKIELQKEGAKRTYELLKFDNERKIAEIERLRNDAVSRIETEQTEAKGTTNYDATFFKAKLARVNDLYDELVFSQQQQNKRNLSDYLKQQEETYLTFEEQKVQIAKEAQKKIDDLLFLGEQQGDKNKYKKKIEGIQKDLQKALFELEKSQGSGIISELFGDTMDLTVSEMENLIARAEEFYNEIPKTDENVEQLEAVRTQIEKLKDTVDETQNGLERMAKNIDIIFSGKSSEQSRLKALGEFQQDLSNVNGLVGMFSDSLKSIGDISGADAFGGITEGLQQFTQVLDNTMSGAMAGAQVGGSVGAVIGGVLGFGSSALSLAADAEANHRKAMLEIKKSELATQKEYNNSLLEQAMLMEDAESIFGVDALAKAVGYIEIYNQSLDKLNTKLTKQEQTFSLFGQTITTQMSALDAIEVKTGHKKTGLFGWGKGKDIYTSITDVYGDLLDAEGNLNIKLAESIYNNEELKGQGKERLGEIIDLYKQAEEAREEFVDGYLKETFGSLGGDFVDSIIEGLEKGEDAFESFQKSVGDILGQLGRQLLEEVFISSKFKNFQKELEQLYSSGKSKENIVGSAKDLLIGFVDSLKEDTEAMTELAKAYNSELKQQGYDVWGSEEAKREATRKGFASMSQDSANELNGRFTVIQGHTYEINNSVKILKESSAKQLKHLSGIESNTSKLIAIESDIKDVRRGIDDINVKGIKLKR